MIAVISDTHIGTSEAKLNESSLLAFLDHAESQGWRLVLNGDTFDLWAHSFARILKRCRTVVTRIRDYRDKVLIAGNHDNDPEDLAYLAGVSTKNITHYLALGHWCVMHGYQLDPTLQNEWVRGVVGAADRIANLVDFDALNEIRKAISKADRTNEPLLEGAAALPMSVCCGHSHVPYGTPHFLNTGSWVDDPILIAKGAEYLYAPRYALFAEDGSEPELHIWASPEAGRHVTALLGANRTEVGDE